MPKVDNSPQLDAVQHEHFCLPREDATEPRIEGFLSYTDADGGRSRPAAFVTRCLECGAAKYRPISD